MTWLVIVEGLTAVLVLVGVPVALWRQQRLGIPPAPSARLLGMAGVVGLVFVVAALAGIRPAEVGLGAPGLWRFSAVSIVATVAIISVDLVSTWLLIGQPAVIRRRLQALSRWPDGKGSRPTVLAAFIIAAACYEEILFRGFGFLLADRLAVAPLLALLALSLVFGFQHLASGLESAAYACMFGLFFAIVYLVADSIYPPIIAHAAGNAFTLFYTRPKIERRLALMSEPSFLF